MIALLAMSCKERFFSYISEITSVLIVLTLITVIPALTLTGCGVKTVLSDDAVRFRNIHDYVNKLKELYEQRDERVTSMFSREYLTKDLTEGILKDFEKFNNISLKFFIEKVEVEKGNVDITVHWNGIWKDVEKTYIEGGSMVLMMQYEDAISSTGRIIGIKGDKPFGISKRLLSHEN